MYQDIEPEVRSEIDKVLDEHVRPLLFSHGGDMEILEFKDGILKFKLMGKCAGCPAADLTTEEIIQSELTAHLPIVKQAVLVQETSQELIDEARRILAMRNQS